MLVVDSLLEMERETDARTKVGLEHALEALGGAHVDHKCLRLAHDLGVGVHAAVAHGCSVMSRLRCVWGERGVDCDLDGGAEAFARVPAFRYIGVLHPTLNLYES